MHHNYIDHLAMGDTPAHRLDARAKLVVVIVFTALLVSVPRYEVAALFPYAILPFAWLAFGGVPLGFVAKRLLLVSPFILFVAAFNPLFDAAPVLVRLGPWAFWVRGGVLSCASVCGKFILTVSILVALVSTTRFHDLLKAMAWFRLPRLFIVVLSFLYRYLFLLVEQVQRMKRARECRAVGPGRLGWSLRSTGGIIGNLFLRTLERGERVHAAMAARGFDGSVKTLTRFRMRAADYAFLAGGVLFVAALRFGALQ
ncbi:MAG: cobalt ECF transporter T component CbiQ [Planctomycetes bacterium]|nr:cobalt ECF transporter T component CbiQ [Planctomycetota bacterium]